MKLWLADGLGYLGFIHLPVKSGITMNYLDLDLWFLRGGGGGWSSFSFSSAAKFYVTGEHSWGHLVHNNMQLYIDKCIP